MGRDMLAPMTDSRTRSSFPTPIPLRAHALRAALALAIAALLIAAPISAAVAQEEPVWLATGPVGGTYRAVYGANLVKLLHDFQVFFRDSEGSSGNLQLLLDGKADIAFVQGDVYALAHESAPAVARDLVVIGQLSDECVYIARRKDGRIESFDDLKDPDGDTPARVAVGPPEGGPAGTWLWLANREPSLATAEIDTQGGTLALNQLAVGRFDAVVWVTDPTNFGQKMLRTLQANSELELMPVTEKTLLEPLPDGTVVYRKMKVKTTDGWPAKKLETICTSALVLMRRDADPLLLERVSDAVALHREAIVPKTEQD
jgi:TRAP-type uncharacterized transport system substrate-binding protein